MRPDRIIVGADDERAVLLMRALYSTFTRNHDRVMVMDIKSAEFTKYAANAMLATRISFMNEPALLADQLGVDIELVRKGIGSDPRIGYHLVLEGSEALLIVTDWKECKYPDFDAIKALLKQPVTIDGRNPYEPALMESLGFDYVGIGRGVPSSDASPWKLRRRGE